MSGSGGVTGALVSALIAGTAQAQKIGHSVVRVVYRTPENNDNAGVFTRIPEKPTEPWMAGCAVELGCSAPLKAAPSVRTEHGFSPLGYGGRRR